MVLIRITHTCNLRCSFCGQHGAQGVYNIGQPQGNELSTSDWISFLDQVAAFRPYLHFTGGEPLLRADLSSLIAYASSRGLLAQLSTNGTLLEQSAFDLVAAGLDYISVSLDALASASLTVTGSAETHAKVIRGVRRLFEARRETGQSFPIVQVFITVHEHNQHHLYDLAEIANDLGADVTVICFPIFTTPELLDRTRAAYRRELGVEPRYWNGFVAAMNSIDISVIERQLSRIWQTRWNMVLRQLPARDQCDVERHFRRPEEAHRCGPCSLCWTSTSILPNGDVATCWDHPDFVAGNIQQERLLDIWNGPLYAKFRSVIARQPFATCGRCTGLYQPL